MESRPAHIIALSEPGVDIARKIRRAFQGNGQTAHLYLPRQFARPHEGELPVNGDFRVLVADIFPKSSCMVFVTAAGIAVRAIAGALKDKRTDPAVLVVDNRGQFVISLLSGHIGKANEWTRKLAAALGATPVITTASDSLGIPALDELAISRGWHIENWEAVKPVMAAIINRERVLAAVDRVSYLEHLALPSNVEIAPIANITEPDSFAASFVISSRAELPRLPEPVLVIRPRNVIVGIGCKRGIPSDEISQAVHKGLQAAGRSLAAVRCLATIEIKRDDIPLLEAASSLGLPLEFIKVDDLARVEDRFAFSPFVKSQVGAGNVCEAAAYLCGSQPEPVLGKTSYGGITVAVFEDVWDTAPVPSAKPNNTP